MKKLVLVLLFTMFAYINPVKANTNISSSDDYLETVRVNANSGSENQSQEITIDNKISIDNSTYHKNLLKVVSWILVTSCGDEYIVTADVESVEEMIEISLWLDEVLC